MTRDLIIGVVLSLALHLLILFGDKLIPEKKVVKKVVKQLKLKRSLVY